MVSVSRLLLDLLNGQVKYGNRLSELPSCLSSRPPIITTSPEVKLKSVSIKRLFKVGEAVSPVVVAPRSIHRREG